MRSNPMSTNLMESYVISLVIDEHDFVHCVLNVKDMSGIVQVLN